MECPHRRLRHNYPFGKNSKPSILCKDCGKPLKPKELSKRGKRKR